MPIHFLSRAGAGEALHLMNRLRALGIAATLTACSDSISVLSSTTSGAGGTGGNITSAVSASGSGGAGGAGSAGSAGSGGGISFVAATSVTSSSSGGASKCLDAYLDVVGDGAPQHYTSMCASILVEGNPTGPVAYTPTGGGIISSLSIVGCASSSQASAGLTLAISNVDVPGTDTKATASYVDAAAQGWASMGAGTVSVTIDVYEDIPGVVEGSYTAVVQGPSSTKTLFGGFRVCHVYDLPKP